MARRNMGGRGRLVRGEQKYCPVQDRPGTNFTAAPPPMRLAEDTPTETPRMRSAHNRNVGNLSYPGDASLAGPKARVYEKGRKNQTRSSS